MSNKENIIESFSHDDKHYWASKNTAGKVDYYVSNGLFKGAGSRPVSQNEYNRLRRNPGSSVPKQHKQAA